MNPSVQDARSASTTTRHGSSRSVTIDARMVNSSGIGTYLQNVLPRVLASNPEIAFRLIGGEDLAAHEWSRKPRVEQIVSSAPLYSVREQIGALARSRADRGLFWSPHYNIPLAHRGKLLVTLHDVAHLALPELVRGPHRRAYARLMFRGVRRATARIFVSRFTADEYARLVGPLGRADVVIYQGVSESWFAAERIAPPHPRPYLLFVGNVKPHKNLRGLLSAYSLLQSDIPHDLVIVGRKEGFIHGDPEVVESAARLADRVHFTGWVEDSLLQQYLLHAEALVFPSLYEGFGLPPLEAMACGCPVIASRAASLPEVCGDAVLYCDPRSPGDIATQTRRLLENAPLRAELVERGRAQARRFTWDGCALETTQVVRGLVG